MHPVLGNVTSLMTRYLYNAIENRIKWDLNLKLEFPDFINTELIFWFKNLRALNKKFLAEYRLPKILVYSDASNIASGAFCTVGVDEYVFHQMWSSQEMNTSSTWRENLKLFL